MLNAKRNNGSTDWRAISFSYAISTCLPCLCERAVARHGTVPSIHQRSRIEGRCQASTMQLMQPLANKSTEWRKHKRTFALKSPLEIPSPTRRCVTNRFIISFYRTTYENTGPTWFEVETVSLSFTVADFPRNLADYRETFPRKFLLSKITSLLPCYMAYHCNLLRYLESFDDPLTHRHRDRSALNRAAARFAICVTSILNVRDITVTN